jgi:glutamate formiminotransferase/formiminotetrahydrofolate cyclodeaminase
MIVECVPNFSEGRKKDTIQAIARAASSVSGVSLLDVDSGQDTNRTVYTFVGDPGAVADSAFAAIQRGSELIDMSKHRGAHPRMGACDVCPFVPVSGITMEECVEIAVKVAERVGGELGIPVYLYEQAARTPRRKNLASVRAGEYEALKEKLVDPEWRPDFGPVVFNERVRKSGATAIGAREFLIAFNLNLDSKDVNLASRIAEEIREKGKVVRNTQGAQVRVPGKLKHCKAIGWYVEDYGRAQVSMNLTNYHVTNMHHAFEAARAASESLGVRITGSEIVGLVPKNALLQSGRYFLEKAFPGKAFSRKAFPGKAFPGKGAKEEAHGAAGYGGYSEKEIIDTAVDSLGLNDIDKFEPREKIIEYRISP